jgi:putative transposase
VIEIYEVIEILSPHYPIRMLCKSLKVSFSAYYAWKRKESHVQSVEKSIRAEQVKGVFEAHRRRYGAIRVSKELARQGVNIGRHQTATLMKQQGLIAIQPKSFVPKTTQTDPDIARSNNLLLDRPKVSRPYEVIGSDITYLPLRDGNWAYLVAFQDVFTRVIVGWALEDNMCTELIVKALQKAIDRKPLPKGLIVHSDGGSQYSSKEFRQLLKKHQFVQSMTRKNNHYDNAQAESLWSRFKAELLEKGVFDSLQDAYTETFEYIEIYYNRQRLHSGLNYQFPCTFEKQFLDDQNAKS